ncbi:hypothetical protein FS837_004753, partial [Tulasnella sp. UAMH 9824]
VKPDTVDAQRKKAKLSFNLTSPCGDDVELFKYHMIWLNRKAKRDEMYCTSDIAHTNERVKGRTAPYGPDPLEAEPMRRFAERTIEVATYLIPEISRILEECENQPGGSSYIDVEEGLRNGKEALEIFRRLP